MTRSRSRSENSAPTEYISKMTPISAKSPRAWDQRLTEPSGDDAAEQRGREDVARSR